jgi:hypothetical protein
MRLGRGSSRPTRSVNGASPALTAWPPYVRRASAPDRRAGLRLDNQKPDAKPVPSVVLP